MLTSFDPRAGLKALLIPDRAFAAAVVSPLSPERARDPAVLRHAGSRTGPITAFR